MSKSRIRSAPPHNGPTDVDPGVDTEPTMTADGNADQSAADRTPEYMPCVNCSVRSQDGDPDHLCDHCRQESAVKVNTNRPSNGERKKVGGGRPKTVQFWVARLDEYGFPKTLIVRTPSVRSATRKLLEYSRALGIPEDAMGVMRIKPVKPKSEDNAAA